MKQLSPEWLTQFMDVYQQLSTDNLATLTSVYHVDIQFQDPLHRVSGMDALMNYFLGLYQHLKSCDFTINHWFASDNEAAIYWTMTFVHPSLNKARPVTVEGHSKLEAKDGKVIAHRDYLDVGAMLYEHIPLLGSVVKHVKKRAAN